MIASDRICVVRRCFVPPAAGSKAGEDCNLRGESSGSGRLKVTELKQN